MGIRFSQWVAPSIVLHSTLTSALVVPRAAYSGNGEPYGTGHIHPTTIAASSSMASQASSLGSSIVPPASIIGTYPVVSGPTITGWPSAASSSSIVPSSVLDYPAESSVPPPEDPATSDYPAVTPTSNVAWSTGGGYGPSPAPVSPHLSKLTSSAIPESSVTPSNYSSSCLFANTDASRLVTLLSLPCFASIVFFPSHAPRILFSPSRLSGIAFGSSHPFDVAFCPSFVPDIVVSPSGLFGINTAPSCLFDSIAGPPCLADIVRPSRLFGISTGPFRLADIISGLPRFAAIIFSSSDVCDAIISPSHRLDALFSLPCCAYIVFSRSRLSSVIFGRSRVSSVVFGRS
ncbi:hypothetical protein J4E86_009526 [Alternaria arbusti]|uniref:uncharacterized protein n=1 Tax=Alternaria arbusti TaxID=232088 RepID=UPI00221EA5EC|nr:uncharacterized protein J4E86_009526 [Alternaria arbusti]KAI4944467.1 hypothetical protein J4E86_009526 [Alternaria arbusti]